MGRIKKTIDQGKALVLPPDPNPETDIVTGEKIPRKVYRDPEHPQELIVDKTVLQGDSRRGDRLQNVVNDEIR
ncbi:MAG: hypothetical protein N2691_01735 [Patescibacteria group bacterium]|nr:hypothetical protein [Patescibacteria group bacterium]